MKETGIIMSGPHPLDILEGRKTQTRRTWGLEEMNKEPDNWILLGRYVDGYNDRWRFRRKGIDEEVIVKCPYGGPGDRLWVRETYAIRIDGKQILHKATFEELVKILDLDTFTKEWGYPPLEWGYPPLNIKWRSSMFMPRRHSRILLEITDVRAERLQDIPLVDVKKEGIYEPSWYYYDNAIDAFAHLWDSLNAKRGHSWDKNEWVWVITFQLLDTK